MPNEEIVNTTAEATKRTHKNPASEYDPQGDWVTREVTDQDGKRRQVLVRRGSVFRTRPKFKRAS